MNECENQHEYQQHEEYSEPINQSFQNEATLSEKEIYDYEANQQQEERINQIAIERARQEAQAQRENQNLQIFRDHNHIFEVYRQQLQNGQFALQRKLILQKILYALITFTIHILLICWVILWLPRVHSQPLYYSQKIWIGSWIISQNFAIDILLFASIFAYINPVILLSERWQLKVRSLYMFAEIFQFFVFLSVIFVDVFKYLYMWLGIQFTYSEIPLRGENSLNLICKSSQLCVIFFIICFIYVLNQINQQKAQHGVEAGKVLEQFKKAKKQSWLENQKNLNLQSENNECSFCLQEYLYEDQVIQLKCHKNHVFHESCFKTFLEYVKKEGVSEAKCTICKKAIEFYNKSE